MFVRSVLVLVACMMGDVQVVADDPPATRADKSRSPQVDDSNLPSAAQLTERMLEAYRKTDTLVFTAYAKRERLRPDSPSGETTPSAMESVTM